MRLDAMLGKSTVGIEKKIQEPTVFEARRNVSSFVGDSHGILQRGRRPYAIPAASLLNRSQNHNKSENG